MQPGARRHGRRVAEPGGGAGLEADAAVTGGFRGRAGRAGRRLRACRARRVERCGRHRARRMAGPRRRRAHRHVDTMGSSEVSGVVGPCIHAECYEFGVDDLDRVARGRRARRCDTTSGARPRSTLVAGIATCSRAAGSTVVDRRGRLHRVHVRVLVSPCAAATRERQAMVVWMSRAVSEAPAERRSRSCSDRIATAGGDPDTVTFVAVTKGFGLDVVLDALGCGPRRPRRELRAGPASKADALDAAQRAAVRWHFIGRLQTNKVRLIASARRAVAVRRPPALAAEIAKRRLVPKCSCR